MPKRKSNPCNPNPGKLSLASFDAALDLLACETFTRLDQLSRKFEVAAGVSLQDGVVQTRWEEAVKRYWVMKGMDDLCCTMGAGGSGSNKGKRAAEGDEGEAMSIEGGEEGREKKDARPLPSWHPGAPVVHAMCDEEEFEWRKWQPKVGDVVLVELESNEIWPGKIIDKKVFFQGRTVPRGYHFFPVRIYNEAMNPVITIKSRLIPLHLRPSPPLLASQALQSAYHHAGNPQTFDMLASSRESLAAHNRTHPGVRGNNEDDVDKAKAVAKAEKEGWNRIVNWVMNERRGEKLRLLHEEREKRLRSVIKSEGGSPNVDEEEEGVKVNGDHKMEDIDSDNTFGNRGLSEQYEWKKKRRTSGNCPGNGNGASGSNVPSLSNSISSDTDKSTTLHTPWATRSGSPANPPQNGEKGAGGIFGSFASTPCATIGSVVNYIRPSFLNGARPASPRRFEKRPGGYKSNGSGVGGTTIYSGIGEYSPRGSRGLSYTPPPRILPSGDDTAPTPSNITVSPVPTRPFDFVSPLGPVSRGRLDLLDKEGGEGGPRMLYRKASLEAVKEVAEEGEDAGNGGDGWTLVARKQRLFKRADSAPCADKKGMMDDVHVKDEMMVS